MQNAAKFWDKVAGKYAKSPIADMDAYTQTLELTRSYLRANDHILEIGCGTGSTALLLAENVNKITASDISANMTKIGSDKGKQQNISNVTFINADLFDSALGADIYDAVLALNLLHLIEDMPAAIRRINDLLKPGGVFISKTFCVEGAKLPFKTRMMMMVLPLMQKIGKAPYVSFMSIAELENAITSAGFEIVEAGNYPASSSSRYVVARKS